MNVPHPHVEIVYLTVCSFFPYSLPLSLIHLHSYWQLCESRHSSQFSSTAATSSFIYCQSGKHVRCVFIMHFPHFRTGNSLKIKLPSLTSQYARWTAMLWMNDLQLQIYVLSKNIQVLLTCQLKNLIWKILCKKTGLDRPNLNMQWV